MKISSIKSKTYLSQLRYKPFFNSFFTYTISSIRPITSTFRNFANLIRSRIRGHFSKRFSTAVFKGFCVHHREIPVQLRISKLSSSQSQSLYTQRSLRFILLYQCLRPSLSPRFPSLLRLLNAVEDEAGRGDIAED